MKEDRWIQFSGFIGPMSKYPRRNKPFQTSFNSVLPINARKPKRKGFSIIDVPNFASLFVTQYMEFLHLVFVFPAEIL